MFTTAISVLRPHNRGLVLTLLALASLVLAGSTQAAGPPLPIDDYWQQVEETQTLVASLENAPDETVRTRLLAVADRWESITELTLSDETTIPIDHNFLVSQLRADPPDLEQLDRLLTALLTARDAWSQSETASPDTETLDQILARPEFQWPSEQPSPLAEWWRQLRQRFWEFIARILPSSGGESASAGVPLLQYAFTALGSLALILVLAYALRGLLADFVAETEITPEEIADKDMTAATALKQAQLLSGEGDYRAAVRYLYLSSLLLLEERGLLHYDRSLTNREYLRTVAHLPQLAAILRDVVRVFDRVWYGYQPLDEAAYTRYADRVAELGQQK